MTKYIDADALMKDFDGIDLTKCVKYGNKDAEQQRISYSTMMMYEIADALDDAPAADVVEVRHGRWVKIRGVYRCTECHYVSGGKTNYCPNCALKMDKEDA